MAPGHVPRALAVALERRDQLEAHAGESNSQRLERGTSVCDVLITVTFSYSYPPQPFIVNFIAGGEKTPRGHNDRPQSASQWRAPGAANRHKETGARPLAASRGPPSAPRAAASMSAMKMGFICEQPPDRRPTEPPGSLAKLSALLHPPAAEKGREAPQAQAPLSDNENSEDELAEHAAWQDVDLNPAADLVNRIVRESLDAGKTYNKSITAKTTQVGLLNAGF